MRTFTLAAMTLFLAVGCSGQENATDGATSSDATTGSGDAAAVTPEQVKKEVSEAADASMAFARQKKAEYEKTVATELERLDGRIATLRKQTQDAKAQAREKLDATLERVRARRAQVQSKLDDLRGKSSDAWADLKVGLDSAMGELKKAYADARKEFEGDPASEEGG